uniref:Uncharacterized protein n=1 Tax=Engystomops pustulosus TaxID=76066 RepID=A0AAV6YUW6_ENGPU|nr:hypothetical protein GDO81_018708 [Engystomops pustulosus]
MNFRNKEMTDFYEIALESVLLYAIHNSWSIDLSIHSCTSLSICSSHFCFYTERFVCTLCIPHITIYIKKKCFITQQYIILVMVYQVSCNTELYIL